MRRLLREFRRAPGRIVASVLAMSLALGAVGVMAIPTISEAALHEAVARDRLADITISTTPMTTEDVARVANIAGVASLDREVDIGTATSDGRDVRAVGLELRDQQQDMLQLVEGRQPEAPGEVVASKGVAAIGDTLPLGDATFTVVGVGSTLWWSDADAVFGDVDDVIARLGLAGANRLALTAVNDDIAALRRIGGETRTVLAQSGVTFTDFPLYLPDGTTPIDEDIRQVSTLIGLLGIVAGIVALVLLGSTANTLITERTREVAVMRALGGRTRPMRRRLRRIALGITAAALVIGLPLGVFISNLIARMVLEKFVGITPDVAVSWPVVAASAAGALFGARLVAARAARRVTSNPLAESLRDREGAPFGRRLSDRLVTRAPFGGLRTRMATRASVHRRSRALAMVAQIAAGVGAIVIIIGLATSVNEYNQAARAPWSWESRAIAVDPGLPFDATIEADVPTTQTGIAVFGEVDDREIDVFGLAPEPRFFDPMLRSGRWIGASTREAVMSDGFARHRKIAVGDTIEVELATGPASYTVVGLSQDASRAVYVDRSTLARDLAHPGRANGVWSSSEFTMELPGSVEVATAAQVATDDAQGRKAIVAIFGTIAAIVAGVAALATISTLAVNLYERRYEVATLQALGASRRKLRGLIARELMPLGALGVALGLVAGWFGTRGIMASFEASNEVDIGASFAWGAVAPIVVGAAAVLLLLGRVAVRSTGRRPLAATLRGAA